MDATTPALSLLLRRIAGHRDAAARLTAEIDAQQRQMNQLLYRRVPGELVDAIEDEILALRDRLMANDAAMMVLVAQARQANDRRPEPRRLDLELAFRAMKRAQGGDHAPA
jgi:anti-sigma factor ChrR (cupin superfamily)